MAPLVIVVDDDDAVRDSLGTLLEAQGFTVRSFASAFELLDSNFHSQPDCLLLDYHMPEMNGIDLINELARRGSIWPTILITGLYHAIVRQRALAAGVLEVLQKPSPNNLLIEAVRRAVRSPPGRSAQ